VRKNVFSIGSSMFIVSIGLAACTIAGEVSPVGPDTAGTTGSATGGAGGSSSGAGTTTTTGTTTGTGTGTGTSTGGGSGTGTGTGGSGGASDAGSDPCLAGTSIDNLENQANWTKWKINKDTSGGTITPSDTFAAEQSADGNGYAAHVKGSGFTQWGAGLLRSFDPSTMCVAKSKGIKFRAKGPGTITFATQLRQQLPPSDGGTCMVAADCYNGHETQVTLTAGWADYNLDWTRLAQPAWGPRIAFNASDVLQLLFTARVENQPFDFWLDDITLVGGTTGPNPGVDGGPPGSCVLDKVLGQSIFNGWFPGRANVYTYAGLCTALAKPLYAKFANNGDTTTDKREVAAFFAHVAWETGNLVFTDQQSKDPATGMYWGRGPLQLTWDYNYNACGSAIGQPLVAQPNLVSTDPVVTWETALWFWLYNDSGKGFTSHAAIARGSFGDTLRVINSIECTAGNALQQNRINNYTRFCGQLMVDPGTQLTCQ
jgi:Chitinase class I